MTSADGAGRQPETSFSHSPGGLRQNLARPHAQTSETKYCEIEETMF